MVSTTTESYVKLANALVFSDLDIVNDRYVIKAGTSHKFTVAGIASFTGPLDQSLNASITKIPYWVGERRTTVHEFQLEDIAAAYLARIEVE